MTDHARSLSRGTPMDTRRSCRTSTMLRAPHVHLALAALMLAPAALVCGQAAFVEGHAYGHTPQLQDQHHA
jgi:hypothetical protein